jgi:hypothetical protein
MSNRFIPASPAVAAATGQSGYEFGPEDNDVLLGLARSMKFVAVVSLVCGMILMVLAMALISAQPMTAFVREFVQGLVTAVIGGWLLSAAGSLRDVATTTGADIPNLMFAMRKLRQVFTLQAILLAVVMVVVVLAIVLAIGR